MQAKELIEYVVKELVDYPDEVEILENLGQRSVILELKVHSDDIGKVIGKKGRIAKALRVILNATANKEGKKATLEILE